MITEYLPLFIWNFCICITIGLRFYSTNAEDYESLHKELPNLYEYMKWNLIVCLHGAVMSLLFASVISKCLTSLDHFHPRIFGKIFVLHQYTLYRFFILDLPQLIGVIYGIVYANSAFDAKTTELYETDPDKWIYVYYDVLVLGGLKLIPVLYIAYKLLKACWMMRNYKILLLDSN